MDLCHYSQSQSGYSLDISVLGLGDFLSICPPSLLGDMRSFSPERRGQIRDSLALARAARLDSNAPPRLNARRFAFSVLVAGAAYQQVADVFLWMGLLPPAKTSFYTAQTELFPILENLCRTIVDKYKQQMMPEAVCSFDGSWSHSRNAKECIVVLIDCFQKKIVDFQIMHIAKNGMEGNHDGSPNGMEVAALRLLIARWKDTGRIKGVVRDNDSKARQAIKEENWEVDEWFDPNHFPIGP
jgi:hypothetical protein